jgi:hypothetical protein
MKEFLEAFSDKIQNNEITEPRKLFGEYQFYINDNPDEDSVKIKIRVFQEKDGRFTSEQNLHRHSALGGPSSELYELFSEIKRNIWPWLYDNPKEVPLQKNEDF